MPSGTDRIEMISRIGELPRSLAIMVANLSDDQLDTPYGEGKWTVRQVVHHLADAHLNAFVRMKLILTEDNPTLKPYDQEKWAETSDSVSMNIQSSLLILTGLHSRWCELMKTLTENDWSRTADHPETGKVSLDDLLKIYSEHGDKHLGHIKGLIRDKGW